MSHPCGRKGCEKVGTWRVGFIFEAVGGSPPAHAQSGVRLCQQHREEATFEQLFTSTSIAAIQDGLRKVGKAPADPSSFKLTFERGD